MRRILFVLMANLAFISQAAFAQTAEEIVSITAEGASKSASSVEAAKEIQSEAVATTVRKRVLDIVGEKRFAKSKSLIENKIVRQSSKFIPYITAGAPERQPDGSWKMSVEMKLSTTSLRKMILDAGLLVESDGPSSILPMVSFIDRQSGTALRWWTGESRDEKAKTLMVASQILHDAAQTEFSRQGFHLIRPLGLTLSPLPEPFRLEQPTSADYLFASDYYQAPMILKGDVRLKPVSEPAGVVLCAIKLQVVQVQSGRTVAEVSRQFDFDSTALESSLRSSFRAELPELTKDLAIQVHEAWQRGTLNTNQVRLAVLGRLTPKRLAEFKAGLLQGLSEIKSVRERLFEGPQEVVLDVDYTGDLSSLVDRLKMTKIPAFETRMGTASANRLVIHVN